MKVINKGIFKPIRDDMYRIIRLSPVDFDISDRQVWLEYIQHIDSHMVGSSNYTTDYEENWYLIFRVNSGNGDGKSYRATENYLMVLEIQIYTWYRPEDRIREEVIEGLKQYPIIYLNELLGAFKQRGFYRNSELINL